MKEGRKERGMEGGKERGKKEGRGGRRERTKEERMDGSEASLSGHAAIATVTSRWSSALGRCRLGGQAG